MSLVELRIELPAYTHSFVLLIPRTCTIAQVKLEIQKLCPGGPRVDGQRVISRGRYLLDHEIVDELWKSPDEPRIIHLAVHPSAWTSSPPSRPAPPPMASAPLATSAPFPRTHASTRGSPISTTHAGDGTPYHLHPLAYILRKHQTALCALTKETRPAHATGDISSELARSISVQAVAACGWSWPPILDQDFPIEMPGGVLYDYATIDGQPFLSLRSPGIPTARQSHALKVLTYTFNLLSIPVSHVTTTPAIASQYVPMPPHVNQVLQQMGLPQALAARNIQPPPNQFIPPLRELPLRHILASFTFLLLRALLLFYFISPTRKPIVGILIVAWMLYEIWRPIRNALWQQLQAPINDQGQRNPPAAQADVNAPVDAQNTPAGNNDVNRQARAILDVVANQNIASEEIILNDVRGTNLPEPSFGHKLATGVSLMFTTMHPAIWNRRRVALGRREGRIRTEANLRNSQPTDDEDANRGQARADMNRQYSQRPRWVREYIDRVVVGDWVDDSD